MEIIVLPLIFEMHRWCNAGDELFSDFQERLCSTDEFFLRGTLPVESAVHLLMLIESPRSLRKFVMMSRLNCV